MARMAYLEFGADWIINNDADEFWWPIAGDLKATFGCLPGETNLVKADRYNFIVVAGADERFWSRMIYREKVSLNPLGRPLPPKVAHRGSENVKVHQGNHSVEGIGDLEVADGLIEILHFPIRSYQQIENKIVKGGAAYERNKELNESVGITWRELYSEYRKVDNLNAYFQSNLYNVETVKNQLATGDLILDKRLFEFFQ